ncbi:MAG: hypothetical protein ACK5DD_02105 [Cyclobacteriaceae bacterium]|jgi:hypothetical protein
MAQRTGWVFGIGALVTVSFAVFMGRQISPLHSGDIIAFEFAFTLDRVDHLLDVWQQRNIIFQAFISLYLDFIFIILYSVTLTVGSRWATARLKAGVFLRLGRWLSGNVGWAGLCDVVENCCLLMLLQQYTYAALPVVAALCAAVKFFLVVLAIMTIIRSFFN